MEIKQLVFIQEYIDVHGVNHYRKFTDNLKDKSQKATIDARLKRIQGN